MGDEVLFAEEDKESTSGRLPIVSIDRLPSGPIEVETVRLNPTLVEETKTVLMPAILPPIPKERPLKTLKDREVVIATLAHDWVDAALGDGNIIRFLDLCPCKPMRCMVYEQESSLPIGCWHVTFELKDHQIVHILVAGYNLAFNVEFMFVEENPVARTDAQRHTFEWHSSNIAS